MLGQNCPLERQTASLYGYPMVSDVSNGIYMQYGDSGTIINTHN